MLKITIATIFPELFPGALGISLLKKAMEKKIWQLDVIDIRNYGTKGRIDDKIFGGLPGMLIKPEIIEKLIETNEVTWDNIFYTDPTGVLLSQKFLQNIKADITQSINDNYNILIICGRYEGIDARVIDYYNMIQFSLGEFILCGGELPAMVLVEGLIRLLPNVLGNENSLEDESFSHNCHHQNKKYTRPRIWKQISVPQVLLSGHHNEIKKWKKNPPIK